MRGASSQKEKTRMSEIAYASSRIQPFSLATLPTSYSWNRILPAQIRPGKVKRDETAQCLKQEQAFKLTKHSNVLSKPCLLYKAAWLEV
jgi:hypothetical protein